MSSYFVNFANTSKCDILLLQASLPYSSPVSKS